MSERTGRVLTDAEREQFRYNLLTTGEVARRLSDDYVTGDTVRAWCAAGWLQSVDGRLPGSNRARYLIDWKWVEEFVANGGAAAFRKAS